MRLHIPSMTYLPAIESADAQARIAIGRDRREAELTRDQPQDHFAATLAGAGYPVAPAAA